MSRSTLDSAVRVKISPTGLSPSLACFPKTVRLSLHDNVCSPQPRAETRSQMTDARSQMTEVRCQKSEVRSQMPEAGCCGFLLLLFSVLCSLFLFSVSVLCFCSLFLFSGFCPVWPVPLSLAATKGIDVSFSSCRYLDVSVHDVSPRIAIYSLYVDRGSPLPGFPIRIPTDR